MKHNKWKKSRFGHIVERDGVACAYHSITMQTTFFDFKNLQSVDDYINNNLYDQDLTSDQVNLIDRLKKELIVVPFEYDEFKFLEDIQKRAFDGVHIRVMVLHLTDFCNLACKYCFIEGNIDNKYKRINMSNEVIKASIDKFVQILSDYSKQSTPSIVFYGGEPLLNWNGIKYALEYLKMLDISNKIDKILITNGTLINNDIALSLKEHDVNVSLSIDGNEEHTNSNRVYRDGHGSYNDIIKALKILRSTGIEPSVSCVLAKNNVNDSLDIIKFLVNELKITAVGFNHVSIVPNLNYYDERYEKCFAEALISVQEYIQSLPFDVYERRMNHKINSFLDKKLLRSDCTGCGEQISISPLGEIGICQGYMGSRKTFNNSVFNKKYLPSKDEVFIEWSSRSPITMPQCFDCIALATCGGGCPRNADVLNGSIWERDTAFCHFAKLAQEWLIWESKNL
jgi:uncharacterized protein